MAARGEIEVLADSLADATKEAARAAESGGSYLPVLTHILVKVEDGELTVAGSDMETTLAIGLPSRGDVSWAVAVQAKKFRDYVNTLQGTLALSVTKNQRLRVQSPSSRATFAGLSGDEFPILPDASPLDYIFGEELGEAFSFVLHASLKKQDSHPVLGGVHVWSTGEGLRVEAADGYRMATKTLERELPDVNVILPRDAAEVLSRIGDVDVSATFGDNKATFRYGPEALDTTLINGNYPELERVASRPRDHKKRMLLPRQELEAAMKRALILARDVSNIVTLEGNGGLLVSSETSHGDNLTTQLEVAPPEFKVSVNGRFLLDALRVFDCPEVELRVGDEYRDPLYLVDPEDPSGECVLMPMDVS